MERGLPHVLLVADDPAIREVLPAALTGRYVVHPAGDGEAACAILRSHPIAAILLDAALGPALSPVEGEAHGSALILPLKALSAASILVLTGHDTEALAVRAFCAKATDYLVKPVNLHELRTRLARWVPPVPPLEDPVEQARQHLEAHFAHELNPEELAGQLGLSEAHLRRRFRQRHGMTPRRYLTQVRLRRAAELLRTTNLGIREIAARVGYRGLRRFFRLFRRHFRQTPSAVRTASQRRRAAPTRPGPQPLDAQ